MKKITPFLWFEKSAKEAANFYVTVFGEESKIVSESILNNTPSGSVEIISVSLQGQEFTLMSAGPFKKFNESISFVISCENQEEVDYFWAKLSADPSAEQCGWIKDKFGVSWQIVPKQLGELMNGPDAEKAHRVTQAMMKMKKIIISDLELAYNNKK